MFLIGHFALTISIICSKILTIRCLVTCKLKGDSYDQSNSWDTVWNGNRDAMGMPSELWSRQKLKFFW